MNTPASLQDIGDREAPPLPGDLAAEQPQAWEEIDAGRYMPRRIRGSFRGRVLG